MKRPTISPALLANITDAAPGRLVRKLDRAPNLAEDWGWNASEGETSIETESGETVTLGAETLTDAEHVRCTCLLGPRCLHVLAVVTRLELADALASEPEDEAQAPDPTSLLEEGQRQAAKKTWHTATTLLELGATASGAMAQAELARALHGARAAGLHRLASAGARAISGVRSLRERGSEFTLSAYTNALLETLLVSGTIAHAPQEQKNVAPSLLGTARRTYSPIGNLRLYGLFCEPIIATAGYAGVATYLSDGKGRLYSVVDVVPAEMQSAAGCYKKGVRLAETSLAHQELCREGLFMQGATASADGRLGAGKGVKAVRAAGSAWQDAPLNELWQRPLSQQLEGAYQKLNLPLLERPAGGDLLFVNATIAGVDANALLLETTEGMLLHGVAPNTHQALDYEHNLQLLARAGGLTLSFIGRLLPATPRKITLLAFSPTDKESGVTHVNLPKAWTQRCNLGLDRMEASRFVGLAKHAKETTSPALEAGVDPLAALRRRVQRLALGGRATLPPEASQTIEAEARQLEARMLRHASEVLCVLRQAGLSRGDAEKDTLARAFVAAASYLRHTETALQRLCWAS
ncbi:MAG: SWIM zinc finger family protein [Deltaproteobacteria bacterium]|nr:SWIM zinc finger family protein [Deltaproteobacteria bacterium]